MALIPGRRNTTGQYHDRDDMDGSKEYLGEDTELGMGKGAFKKRLKNEIQDNAYDPETVVEVSSDPRAWGEGLQVAFHDTLKKDYQKSLKKYVKIIKKIHKWLREDEIGKEATSVIGIRSEVGFTRFIWDKACEESEEFKYYSDLIYGIIGERIHYLGLTDSKGQIFKIHSLKNHLPDDFNDNKTVHRTQRIEVIQISQGSQEDVDNAIKESKKRLKE